MVVDHTATSDVDDASPFLDLREGVVAEQTLQPDGTAVAALRHLQESFITSSRRKLHYVICDKVPSMIFREGFITNRPCNQMGQLSFPYISFEKASLRHLREG